MATSLPDKLLNPLRALHPLTYVCTPDPGAIRTEFMKIKVFRESTGTITTLDDAIAQILRFKGADTLTVVCYCPDEFTPSAQDLLRAIPRRRREDSRTVATLTIIGNHPPKIAIPKALWPEFTPIDLTDAPPTPEDITERPEALSKEQFLPETTEWANSLNCHLSESLAKTPSLDDIANFKPSRRWILDNSPEDLASWSNGLHWVEASNALAIAFIKAKREQKRLVVEAAEKGLPPPFTPIHHGKVIQPTPPIVVNEAHFNEYRHRWTAVA